MTFGCSWTFGVAAAWTPGMAEQELKKVAWTSESEDHSFRVKLSQAYGLTNINFAKGGSSNARNFRLARELFANKERLEQIKKNDTIVLWGITSTARNEWWDLAANKYRNFKIGHHSPITNAGNTSYGEIYAKYIYNHQVEVKHLAEEMILWNDLFKFHGIKNIWFDTFNTHKYPMEINNLIRPADLLTTMLQHKKIKLTSIQRLTYHMSSWHEDDPRITLAKQAGLVDPFTLHPSARGHTLIAEILSPFIEERL
jgi:hypothetical protein